MKMMIKYFSGLLLVFICFTACNLNSYDNYDEPESSLEGIIHFQGDSIRVGYNSVTFELWQSGFGRMAPINVTVDQNGSYSAVIYNGDYKLVIPSGQGPFRSQAISETNTDTLIVQLQGSQTLDIEVLPYYMIRNTQFSISGNTISVNFELDKIIEDENAQDIENVELYLSKTRFVDTRTSISTAGMSGTDIIDMNDINLSTDVPEITPTQNYVYARVGVKINNVEDLIFSKIEKINL